MSNTNTKAILHIKDLNISYTDNTVVKNINFELLEGEILGIVGESGAGKSTIGRSIIGLLSPKAKKNGSILFENKNILTIQEKSFCALRGKKIATVFQDPFTSLNPVKTVEYHLNIILKNKYKEKIKTMKEPNIKEFLLQEALSLLSNVGFQNPEECIPLYPHELSGGMLQRVIIALAIAQDPQVLIVDEPTTALDASLRNRILLLLKDICTQKNISIIIISHDIEAISYISDRMLVMQLGQCVEIGSVQKIAKSTKEYTHTLLTSLPQRLTNTQTKHTNNNEIHFQCKNIFWKAPQHKKSTHHTSLSTLTQEQEYILKDVSMSLKQGSCFGLIGESGSGKSSLAQVLAGIHTINSGKIYYKNTQLHSKDFKKPHIRKKIQMVFQNPYSSLNAQHSVLYTLTSPLRIHGISKALAKKKSCELLERVGLPCSFLNRYPKELSGGERQRIAIARSLLLDPEILICDEPTSALDVSVQAQVLQLLQSIQKEFNLTTLFISHDLHVIKYICDEVAVIKNGVIVEQQQTQTLFNNPQHPYSKELIQALQFTKI